MKRGLITITTSPTILKDRIFCFSFHMSFFSVLSLSFPPPGGRQVVTFSLPPTRCLALENVAAMGWLINVVPRGVLKRFKFHIFPFPGHSWEACNLPVKHEYSCLYSSL